jgi:hypothetical protein
MATIDNYTIKVDVQGEQAVEKLKSGITGLGTAIAGIGFAAFANGILQMADAVSDLSAATGLSIGKTCPRTRPFKELDHLLDCFPLHKDPDKIIENDIIWENICKYLNWEYISSFK